MPPLRDGVVDRGQGRIRADEVGEQSEQHARTEDEERSERQAEPRLRLGIEPPHECRVKLRMASRRRSDLLGSGNRRPVRHPSSRVAPGTDTDGRAGGESEQDEDENRHRAAVNLRPAFALDV